MGIRPPVGRYAESAFVLLERIREDKRRAQLLIENAEYTRCEIELAAHREMIVKLEDFMRRRSKIELVVRDTDIACAPGLREACDILFGDDADLRLNEPRYASLPSILRAKKKTIEGFAFQLWAHR